MTGKAIGMTMNQGYKGQPSRLTPVPEILTRPAGEALVFGDPLAVTNGKYVKFTGTDIEALAGVCARGVQQSTAYASQTGETGYAENKPASALRKGHIIVNVGSSTPTANGKVYLTSAGAFTATATSNLLVNSAVFTTGVKDANNNAEIEIGYLPIFATPST